MMLYKLSLGNIKKSFKDYAIYFFTLILGVAVFYIFNAIDSQTIMLEVTSSTRAIIDLMISMLSGVSVFVSFILGFLIIYASRFLMKRRHLEFGIYMTLGMSKGSISKILLIETILIGLISLIVGLFLGIIISQTMSIFVANMFEASLTKFAFVLSYPAILKTIGYFGIMYLIVMIFNTINISKCKLIDLINASKKSEKVKLKNPIICLILFVLSCISLAYAYYLVLRSDESLQEASEILLPIFIGCVATFVLFWSMSGMILRFVKKIKSFYYKDLNSFTFRQISSKINTTVMSMSVICIMLFLTICILSSALSLKNSLNANLKELAPVDIQFYKTLNIDESYLNNGYTLEQIEDSKITLKENLENLRLDYKKYFKDIVDLNTYTSNDLTLEKTLGSLYSKFHEKYPFMTFDTAEELIKLSDYNKLARLFNKEELALGNNEYIIVADYDTVVDIRNEALKENTVIVINNQKYFPKVKECVDGFVYISSNHINTGIIVLPDEALENAHPEKNVLTANYNASNEEEKEKIEEKVLALNENEDALKTVLSGSTKMQIKEASVGLGAMITFIGIYLGIIFLITSAALLSLKELSESTDNKNRYQMLRKIGVDEKMIHKSLFMQILIFFLAPLLVALFHSIFGIKFCNKILITMGTDQLLTSILITALILVLIYGGYFLITYYSSKWIIDEK